MALVSYCLYTDVEAITGKLYTTTSKPTLARVNLWIQFRSARLNARLKQAGYITPAVSGTHPEAYEILKQLVAHIVAHQAENSLYIGDKAVAKRPVRIGEWKAIWDDFLEELSTIKDGQGDGRADLLPDLSFDTESPRFPNSGCLANIDDAESDFEFGDDKSAEF